MMHLFGRLGRPRCCCPLVIDGLTTSGPQFLKIPTGLQPWPWHGCKQTEAEACCRSNAVSAQKLGAAPPPCVMGPGKASASPTRGVLERRRSAGWSYGLRAVPSARLVGPTEPEQLVNDSLIFGMPRQVTLSPSAGSFLQLVAHESSPFLCTNQKKTLPVGLPGLICEQAPPGAF